ncbi:methylmalonyl-CoA epimerase [Fodinisporobacter ferrooxydans]|uniref:Methylmalonyl-CoA epimerase n=1 Tax=Fodinisporobacter ferrooxydans TaxID=2901836 RepID=A0ABY4CHB3_9BACL|nr:methylmalonyl-CoA epimerase [Alicyclobacillaceae bacterium MYW30-H2]
MANQTIRVLVAKPGLDGHDRGALVVAQGLRDAGMEVIYTGLRQTPEQIASIAIQEDVDCVGLSSLSGAHMQLFPEIVSQLRNAGANDVLVIGGGVVPQDDIPYLLEKGIDAVFTPGTPISEIAAYIRTHIQRRGYMHAGINKTEADSDSAAETIRQLTEDTLEEPSNMPQELLQNLRIVPEQLDHIGIAVRSLHESLHLYQEQLGMEVIHEETVSDQNVHILFLKIKETVIELLEPTDKASPIAKFMEKRGPGLHHLAFKVNDIRQALGYAKAAGYQLIDETPRKGAHHKWVAFLHPKHTGGVLTEFCQPMEDE